MSRSSDNQAARQNIMTRLKTSGCEQTIVPDAPLPPAVSLDKEARIERLAELMTAMRTEVHIEGELRTRSYDKDGVKHYTTEVVAQRLQLVGKADKPTEQPPATPEVPADEPQLSEEDIPF